jgi:hypothetical protein
MHLMHPTTRVPLLPVWLVPLIERAGEPVYVIASLAPVAGDPGGLFQRLSRSRRRVVIPTAGGWFGSVDAGSVFVIGVRGPDGRPTYAVCGVPLGSLVDAGLYFGQADQLTMSRANPAGYLDPGYWAKLQRRNALQGNVVDLDARRRQQPVPYAPPAAMPCPTAAPLA